MLPQELPFYFGSHSSPGNGGFPVSLPFQTVYDKNLHMYRQLANEHLKQILHEVYELGSLVDGSISSESGHGYVNKTVDYIKSKIDVLAQLSVLEIGCGNGIILKQLQGLSKKLTGLDPGNHRMLLGLDSITLIRDFFPTSKIKEKFDLIFHFFVLEHIEDPVKFLRDHKDYLTANGRVIFGVPNCEPFLKEGDISIFIHEHFNYFTKKSIRRTAEEAGFFVQDIGELDGMLIVTLGRDGTENMPAQKNEIDERDFERKIIEVGTNLKALFTRYKEEEIAVYVPGRALNYLFLTQKRNCRLVDDNSEIHGKYLPYLLNPVESFDQISNNPPKCILIYSRTFGQKIRAKCLNNSKLHTTEILTISDMD